MFGNNSTRSSLSRLSQVALTWLDSHQLLTESPTRRREVMLISRLHLGTITTRWVAQRVKHSALDFQV